MSIIIDGSSYSVILLLDPEARGNLFYSFTSYILLSKLVSLLKWHSPHARQSKKAYDPDFLYEFPPSSLCQEDFNLEEKGDFVQDISATKQSSKPSKPKSTTAPASPLPSIVVNDPAALHLHIIL